ncbi:hypothetical protein ACU6U9_02425 [Pseudomonas sp. HK3]
MSVYAEVKWHTGTSKTWGVDFLMIDMLRFMHRIVSGDITTDYPEFGKGVICNDLFEIDGHTISPEGAPTNWQHVDFMDVDKKTTYSMLKGYRSDDTNKTGFPTIATWGESLVVDHTTQNNTLFLGKADDFNQESKIFTNHHGTFIKNSGKYDALSIEHVFEKHIFHVWADNNIVLMWMSDSTDHAVTYGTQMIVIGEPLYSEQTVENFSLGLVSSWGGASSSHQNFGLSSATQAMGLEARNIFSGERIINKSYYSSVYAVGYGNGRFSDVRDHREYFPIEDADGNFISQLPVMTVGFQNTAANWHWAKWPQNNIIYHPTQTNNNLNGQLVNIGGKRFIAHGISSQSNNYLLRQAGKKEAADVIWLYLPLDN